MDAWEEGADEPIEYFVGLPPSRQVYEPVERVHYEKENIYPKIIVQTTVTFDTEPEGKVKTGNFFCTRFFNTKIAILYTSDILPCSGYTKNSRITWKTSDQAKGESTCYCFSN